MNRPERKNTTGERMDSGASTDVAAWSQFPGIVISSLLLVFVLAASGLGCSSGGDVADTGGMSGTGISQGSVTAFGSIFVNGVEWNLAGATIEIDGTAASESDLRLGMIVRIEGVLDSTGLTGTATSVVFDDSIEGPIESVPVETVPGIEKSFMVLGRTIFVDVDGTIFDGGASFAGLAMDDVVEVSGFLDQNGAIRATRVEARGQVGTNDEVELRGTVANLVDNMDGTGIFDLGSIVVRYVAGTTFRGVTRATLADGDLVEIKGSVRVSGTEVDADELELEEEGLGSGDVDRVEIEGIVADCPDPADFCIDGIPVVTSFATLEPPGFIPMLGDYVEVEGPLDGGILVANRIESENEDPDQDDVRIEASVTSVDPVARSLVILGVTVVANGDTELADESSVDDESFTFGEILPGDFIEVRGFETGVAQAQAVSIRRDDAAAGVDDVRLQGPVTALDTLTPALSILDQPVPLDVGTLTLYFDALENPRTEEEFFRNPGDVMLGDIVRATDQSAADLGSLTEADEVEIEN